MVPGRRGGGTHRCARAGAARGVQASAVRLCFARIVMDVHRQAEQADRMNDQTKKLRFNRVPRRATMNMMPPAAAADHRRLPGKTQPGNADLAGDAWPSPSPRGARRSAAKAGHKGPENSACSLAASRWPIILPPSPCGLRRKGDGVGWVLFCRAPRKLSCSAVRPCASIGPARGSAAEPVNRLYGRHSYPLATLAQWWALGRQL